jgi:ABC-type hemin transport system substrate-binding protein
MDRKSSSGMRIVSLAPSVTSILLELGVGRELVGVSKWCKDVADVGRRPAVGDCWKLDVREVMRLRPTLLIGSVPFAAEAVGKILEQPVAFLALNPRTLADVESGVGAVGESGCGCGAAGAADAWDVSRCSACCACCACARWRAAIAAAGLLRGLASSAD